MKVQRTGTERLYVTAGRRILRTRPRGRVTDGSGTTQADSSGAESRETGEAATDVDTVPLTGIDGRRLEVVGTVPAPSGVRDRLLAGRGRPAVERVVGAVTAVNLWHPGDGWLATAGRDLFVSPDCRAWTAVRRLPDSSGTAGVLPTAVCHRNGVTYLGEYPLDESATPRVLQSTDGGHGWRVLLSLPTVRHVHSVSVDPYVDQVWLTTGDTDDGSKVGVLDGDRFHVVGSGSQRWRTVAPVFTPEAVFWGMDCAYGDRSSVLRLPRERLPGAGPGVDTDRQPRRPPVLEECRAVEGPLYYGVTFLVGGVRWVAFSTAVEPEPDSTGPADQTPTDGVARVVAASAASDYEEWYDLFAAGRRRAPLERVAPGVAPSVNAYVFLAAPPGRGLVVNPFNTSRHHGELLEIPRWWFRRLDAVTRRER